MWFVHDFSSTCIYVWFPGQEVLWAQRKHVKYQQWFFTFLQYGQPFLTKVIINWFFPLDSEDEGPHFNITLINTVCPCDHASCGVLCVRVGLLPFSSLCYTFRFRSSSIQVPSSKLSHHLQRTSVMHISINLLCYNKKLSLLQLFPLPYFVFCLIVFATSWKTSLLLFRIFQYKC